MLFGCLPILPLPGQLPQEVMGSRMLWIKCQDVVGECPQVLRPKLTRLQLPPCLVNLFMIGQACINSDLERRAILEVDRRYHQQQGHRPRLQAAIISSRFQRKEAMTSSASSVSRRYFSKPP